MKFIFHWMLSLLIPFLFYVSCAEKVDLNMVDSLIAGNEFRAAREFLSKYNHASGLSEMQKQKISIRIRTIDRILFFEPLDARIQEKNWSQAAHVADSLKKMINEFSKEAAGPYLFDYYFKRSGIDTILIGFIQYKKDLEKSVEYYTPETVRVREAYFKLAFLYASEQEYVKAREMMDKAMRTMNFNEMNPVLQQVFLDYMEGKFKKARLELSKVDRRSLDKSWQPFEIFLTKYSDSLTMEERFKLW